MQNLEFTTSSSSTCPHLYLHPWYDPAQVLDRQPSAHRAGLSLSVHVDYGLEYQYVKCIARHPTGLLKHFCGTQKCEIEVCGGLMPKL